METALTRCYRLFPWGFDGLVDGLFPFVAEPPACLLTGFEPITAVAAGKVFVQAMQLGCRNGVFVFVVMA